MDINICVTDHAFQRMKERGGLNKNAAKRMAERAYNNGVTHSETNGKLDKFLSGKALFYMQKGTQYRLYGDFLYCFQRDESMLGNDEYDIRLITVYQLPNNLRKRALKLQSRKAEEKSA